MAVAVAFAEGLSRVRFGRVARQLGISDRTVVYYFPTSAVLLAVGIVPQLVQAWLTWAAEHLRGTPGHRRRSGSSGHRPHRRPPAHAPPAGPESAEAAAVQLGVSPA